MDKGNFSPDGPMLGILRLDCEPFDIPGLIACNDTFPFARRCKVVKGATVESGAKIGANSTILPAVVVGRMALVGAGSVVVSDVPEGAVVAGVPARVIKWVDELSCPYDYVEKPYLQGVKR